MSKPVMCIRWKNGNRGAGGWCALKPGDKLDPTATTDSTACGSFVMLRIGSGRRRPTCPECVEALGLDANGGSPNGPA